MQYPDKFTNDGHFLRMILEDESVRPIVLCPQEEARGKCECWGPDPTSESAYCGIAEAIGEIGLEGNLTGLGIIIGGPVPIEWCFYEMDEFWFRVVGYPTSAQLKEFQKEMFHEIAPGEQLDYRHRRQLNEIIAQAALKPWHELQQETKDDMREAVERLKEDQSRGVVNA